MPIDHNIDDVLSAISATPDANTGDPVADAMTWEQFGVDLNHPAGDVPMPGEAPQEPQLARYQGPKVSGSFRGITDEGTQRAKGFYADADRRIAGQVDDVARMSDAESAQSREHYSAVGDALDVAIQKTQEFQQREAELQQQVVDFNRGAADVEQRMAAQATAERHAYIAQYKEQLAVVKQLAMQSGNPIGQLSRAEAFGLAGAQFAQGFLAVQGIHIDVAGQVDRWVERSMQEHQQKIQNARMSAEDQLHLYELSRQNSADEWEARQRYRGFVIAGLQTSIQLNASRFQSDIAMARAQEQIARLQVEADATERSIADKYFDRVLAISTSEYQRAHQMGSLAIQQKQLALEQAKFGWEKDPRNPKNAKAAATGNLPPISDPEYLMGPDGKPVVDAQGNRVMMNRWQVSSRVAADPVLARDVWKEGGEARENYATYLDSTNKMMAAFNEAKKIKDAMGTLGSSWEAAARLDETGKVQAYIQARDAWAMAKVYNDSGKAATDVEYKRQVNQAYIDKWLARNGAKGEQSMAQLREDGRKKFERHMESFGFEAVPETTAQGTPNPDVISRSVGASPHAAAEDTAILSGEKPTPGTVEKLERRALQKDSEDEDRSYAQVSGAWADHKNLDFDKLKGAKLSDAGKDYVKSLGQSEGAVAVELLAAAYAKPSFFHKHASQYGVDVAKNEESPVEIRKAAYKALTDLSLGNSPTGGSVPADLMDWAGYLKQQIDGDPELSKAMEHDNDVTDSPFAKRLADRPGNK